MSFNVIYERFLDSGKTDMSMGYNLLELAFTLDSRRIRDQKALQRVIDTNEIIRDPVLNILASISIDILGKDRYKDFRLEVKKASKTLSMVQKELIKLPMSKLRFTSLDTIREPSKVKILVEGKTDAELLSHAYSVLTGGFMPYWTIIPGGRKSDTGSASEVKETLLHSYPLLEKNDIVIGIVDHDYAGLSQWLSQRYYWGICVPYPAFL